MVNIPIVDGSTVPTSSDSYFSVLQGVPLKDDQGPHENHPGETKVLLKNS